MALNQRRTVRYATSMSSHRLCDKLDPARFPNMSVQLAAVLGFVMEREYTTPSLADIKVTPDGHVLAWPSEGDGIGHSVHLGPATGLRVNLRRLGMAAGLDEGEWADYAARVHQRLGMDLGGQVEDRP
jgi:hypothetical protein